MRDSRFLDARILIVDDEESNVRALRKLLHAAGYTHVFETTDPQQVRTLYREHDPDLVLLDLNMPGLDGIGVLEQLRTDVLPQVYLPVLVLTGDRSQDARRRALTAGAKDFITKPFEIGRAHV